jgi:ABC-type uncharacterized transport system permease subunit
MILTVMVMLLMLRLAPYPAVQVAVVAGGGAAWLAALHHRGQ